MKKENIDETKLKEEIEELTKEEYIFEKAFSILKLFLAIIAFVWGIWIHSWVFIIFTFVIIWDNYYKIRIINEMMELRT